MDKDHEKKTTPNKSDKDEKGLYKTSPGWKFVENVIAYTVWMTWLVVRFIFQFIWNVIKYSWQARKKEKEGVANPLQKVAKDLADQVLATAITQEEVFIPALALKNAHEDEWSLYMRLFPDRIERTLKTERDRLPWMRANLAFKRTPLEPLTRELAEKAKVDFSFDGAVVLTKKEFSGQYFEKPSQRPIEDASPTISMSAPKSVAPKADADGDDSPTGQVEYTGKVVSAGVVEINPEKGNPYNTFLVTLRSDNGETHDLQGVDLRDQFHRRVFSVNDVIHVLKKTESYKKGNQKRKKNSFAIQVLKRAAY